MRHKYQRPLLIGLAALLLVGLATFLFVLPSYGLGGLPLGSAPASDARPPLRPDELQAQPADHPTTDLACRTCHADTDAEIVFPSGEALSANVDLAALAASAHGAAHAEDPLACTSCHQPAEYQFPHPPVEADSVRAFEVAKADTCVQCHTDPHLTSHPGPAAENPVVCTDCHGSHEVLTAEQLRDGEGTAACVDCHTEAGVELNDPETLTTLIQNGLFAETRVNNDYCLSCHSREDFFLTFPNGDLLSLTVEAQELHDSVHGADNTWDALQCTDCHENYRFPHEPITADTRREYTLEKYTVCADCHETKYDEALDSVHAVALAEGEENAAVCTDCHGAHDTPVPDVPRSRISHTCEQCHSAIFNEYAESVHGEALLEESNPDVATCTDCHGVHNIADPTTTLFRVNSPELCAQCHADESLMAQYDVSTQVFDTYVAEFHGTTITLFDPADPDAEPNTAVCYDCHGVHDIKDPEDPHAGIKENLLETCQKCHPDATANFPDAWTSHFPPSLQNNPLVFLVNLFYNIVIPLTVGFFAFLVATDIYRRVRERLQTKPSPQGAAEGD